MNQSEAMEFFTPAELAQMLKLNIRTIYLMLRKGDLKGIKFGRKSWRVRREDLEAYLHSLEGKL